MNLIPMMLAGFVGGMLTMTIISFYRWFFKHQEEMSKTINGTVQRARFNWKYKR